MPWPGDSRGFSLREISDDYSTLTPPTPVHRNPASLSTSYFFRSFAFFLVDCLSMKPNSCASRPSSFLAPLLSLCVCRRLYFFHSSFPFDLFRPYIILSLPNFSRSIRIFSLHLFFLLPFAPRHLSLSRSTWFFISLTDLQYPLVSHHLYIWPSACLFLQLLSFISLSLSPPDPYFSSC